MSRGPGCWFGGPAAGRLALAARKRQSGGAQLDTTLDDREELPGTGPGLEVVEDPDCRSVLRARRKRPVGDHPGTTRRTRQCTVRAFVHAVNVGAVVHNARLSRHDVFRNFLGVK